jgi:hypothetical protein
MAKLESININKVSKKLTLTIKLKGTRRFNLRMWLRTVILKIGGFILPCKAEIETSE